MNLHRDLTGMTGKWIRVKNSTHGRTFLVGELLQLLVTPKKIEKYFITILVYFSRILLFYFVGGYYVQVAVVLSQEEDAAGAHPFATCSLGCVDSQISKGRQ